LRILQLSNQTSYISRVKNNFKDIKLNLASYSVYTREIRAIIYAGGRSMQQDFLNTSNVEGGLSKAHDLSSFIHLCSHNYHQSSSSPKVVYLGPSTSAKSTSYIYTLRRRFSSNPSPSNQVKLQSAEQNFQLAQSCC